MKDYYRILGIKQTATGEDIRARWIDLIRRFHPDGPRGRRGDKSSLLKSKEINEAYQVLKHDRTRVEYDLKMAYYRRKRGVGLRRLVFSLIIVFVFIIVWRIYTRTPRFGLQSGLTLLSAVRLQGEKVEFSSLSLPIEHRAPRPPRVVSEKSDDLNRSGQFDDFQVQNSPVQAVTEGTQRPGKSVGGNPITGQAEERGRARETGGPNEVSSALQIHPIDNPITPASAIQRERGILQPVRPSLLATEAEVRQFLATYIGRYNRRDVDGFLSLFSAEAVQNQRDQIDSIRRMYADFFNQSRELRYRLEDTRVEIYQNAVNVSARYELHQTPKKAGKRNVWRGGIRWVLVREDGGLRILHLDYRRDTVP